MKSAYLGAFLILFFVAACDSSGGLSEAEVKATLNIEAVEPCGGSDGVINYFPVAVGDVWKFNFVSGNFSENTHLSDRIIGTTEWEFTSVSDCQDGHRVITVQETFEGELQRREAGTTEWELEYNRQWSMPRTFTVDESLITLDEFSYEPLPYLAPTATAPDTLVARQQGPRDQHATPDAYFCSSDEVPCIDLTIKLAENEGLVSFELLHEQGEDFVSLRTLTRTYDD